MANPPAQPPPNERKRLLDPVDRISEVLFGLIMVLTFTSSLSAGDVARDDVRAMLVGAIGCNLAWGLVDAVMYVFTSLTERGRNLREFRAIRGAADPESARRLIADALPPLLAAQLRTDELESMRQRLSALPEPPDRVSTRRDDWLGALAVFLLVFLSTFPVVLPFVFMTDARIALRASNGIAIGLLFLAGYALAKHAGGRRWRTGLTMVVVGSVLVAITIALGG
jgi:uncharacterized membrane protein